MKKAEAMALLDRSYALRPCAHCEPLARQAWKSDSRCPECHTSPLARIQSQAHASGPCARPRRGSTEEKREEQVR